MLSVCPFVSVTSTAQPFYCLLSTLCCKLYVICRIYAKNVNIFDIGLWQHIDDITVVIVKASALERVDRL